ncbi:MAG: hypothetical protein IKY73_07060 [Bacteroidaceae bacterium]|nr:hypothetical protein [Bacteroidaceae bacterium]
MKKIRNIVAAFLVIVCTQTSVAQTALSSYFMDGMLYNSKLNPAMKAERGYLSLLLGNTSLGTKGNVGISNFLYPRGENELATFMSGSVGTDEFLGGMPDYTRLGFKLDETLMAAGFRLFGGYFSLGLSLHSSATVSLPKGFFEFAKKGFQENSYSFSGLNVNTMNYAAATVGYSHNLFQGFRFGVNAKYLVGIGHADLFVDKLNVEMNEQHWMIESHARMQAALFCETEVMVDENGVVNGVDLALELDDLMNIRTSNGFAVDLGFVYDMDEFVPGLTLSASVIDLGYINWKYMMTGQSTDAKVEFDGFGEVDYNDVENVVTAEMEQLIDDASKMVEFNYGGIKEMKTALNATMYLGAEYNMPFYRPLSVGVLYGQCFSPFDCSKWYEARGYVNLSPVKWFELSVNYGYGTYGTTLGWVLNFHPAGINLFVGSDYMITRVTPQYIPIDNMNAHVTLGLNLALGKRK